MSNDYRTEYSRYRETFDSPNYEQWLENKLTAARSRIAELEYALIKRNNDGDNPTYDQLAAINRVQGVRLAELESKTYCAYCGAEFTIDDSAIALVTDHIYTCDKHPMRQLGARIAELEAATRWISVSERLPEDGVEVLVAWYWDSRPGNLYLSITRKFQDEASLIVDDFDKTVLYWMPLPKLPEVEK